MTNATIQALKDSIADQGALFNVRVEPVVSSTGVVAENKQMIINDQSNTCLGITSKNYKVVTNEEVVDNLGLALANSGLNLDGIEAVVNHSHGGARSMINVILPAHEIDISGDKSRLQISTLNSYDGRWKYMSRAGAIRMACLNGQILGNFVGSYTGYHNQKLDIEAGAKQIAGMAEDFDKAKDWWIAMMQRKVTDHEVLRAISKYLTGDYSSVSATKKEDFLKVPSVKRLIELFATYEKEMGKNAYALYNAFTDFVTHKKYNADTQAAAMLTAQEKLRETISDQKIFALEDV